MLKFNTQRRWTPWPFDKNVMVLLSPLGIARRAELVQRATVSRGEGKKKQDHFDADKFNCLVADTCIHGLKGFLCDDGPDTPDRELAYSPQTARELMDHDQFNVFVFQHVQSMGLELKTEQTAAGNG